MLTLSQVDAYFVTRELERLVGARVDQAYQYPDGRMRIKLRHESLGVRHLLIDAGVAVYETEWVEEAPASPPAFAAALRKHLENATLDNVRQHEFDKVIIFEFSKANPFELVIELYGQGNILLLAGKTRQILALHRPEHGEKRILAPKFTYAFSAGPRQHFRDLTAHRLSRDLLSTPLDKALFSISDLPRDAARVALTRAGIDADDLPSSIGPVKWEALERVLKELLERPSPRVISSPTTGPRYSSFEVPLTEDENEILFSTVNEALDSYYRSWREWAETHPNAALHAQRRSEAAVETSKTVLDMRKLEAALEQQKEALAKLSDAENTARKSGEWIYQNYAAVEHALAELKASGKKKAELEMS